MSTLEAQSATEAAAMVIKCLNLKPHIEGGFYRQTHQSEQVVGVAAQQYAGAIQRTAGTAILYLLTSDDFSAWHRVKSDELWNYHLGSSMTLHSIAAQTGEYRQVLVGNPLLDATAVPQYTVRAGDWFAVSVNQEDSFILAGCAVFPGFTWDDFELADRTVLIETFPQHRHIIEKYTRQHHPAA